MYKKETIGEAASSSLRRAVALHLALLGAPAALALAPLTASAACVTNGLTTTCDANAPATVTTPIGAGNVAAEDNRRVTIGAGATVSVGDEAAISLRDNANVVVQAGGTVRNVAVANNGNYPLAGANTIEFRDNGFLTVQQGGEVRATGTQTQGEAVNLQGVGNLITNNGVIRADNAAAIWFQTTSGLNTIVNNATGVIQAPGNVIGGQGNAAVDFTNRGTVIGNLVFAGGDDIIRLFAGQTITGTLSGDGGYDRVFLSGEGTGTVTGTFTDFEELTKNDAGTWTLTSAISGPTIITVQQGTLILTGDNSAYAGTMTVNAGGVLQARAQSMVPVITDNGLVRFAQPDAGTYAGLITGTGAVEKTGAGVLTLAPASPGGNTYSGGTTITEGVLAIARDAAIGATTGALTFNGGTLRFDAAFNLAATRPISITAAGGTIDTNALTTTIAQGITGAGALTVAGAGTLILTGASTYAGGTTIAAATRLQIGNGGIGGSIAGNVANAGVLAFNRSDTLVFAGAVSGTGTLRQEGTGTTVLTGASTYTGGTTITAGTLQLGNGGTSGSIAGNVANAGTLAFNRSDTVAFGGVVSGTGGVRQDGTGTTVLTAASTYSGGTRVNAGTLRAGGTNVFSPASSFSVGPAGELALGGFDQTIPGLTNAGLVTLGGAPGTRLTVAGNYVGQGGVVALNTVLGGDNAATDRLVIRGGTATGDTRLRVVNVGGIGGRTVEGIRVVQATDGGTTAAGAFRLDTRVAAGAFEYQLFRGGTGTPDDWYLRNFSPPTVPLFRPETALYAPIPAIGRQMGLATLGTLHERVGEEENIRDLVGGSPYANGGWARAFGERSRNRWDGTVDASAVGNLIGLQAGFDILRTQPYAGGHRDHVGVYVAYTDYNAPNVSGFVLGQQQRAGRLLMSGPAVGAYWTHFGPSGWYVDAVFQANWFEATARSDSNAGFQTNGRGYAASLEAGYPIRFGQNWQIEPQAQVIWQGVSVDGGRDPFSTVNWDEGDAVTGRLGARLQYTGRDERTLWQPYAKVNLWHAFSGTDRVRLGSSAPIENRYGDTALEVGAGITARVDRTTSFYAHADYRWSLDGGRSRQSVTQASFGIRVNW